MPARVFALLLAAAGCGLDACWALAGLIDFRGDSLLPLWMVALWLMFAVVWTRLTCTATLPGWVLATAATVGGPVAYLIGARLGAMTLLVPTALAPRGRCRTSRRWSSPSPPTRRRSRAST